MTGRTWVSILGMLLCGLSSGAMLNDFTVASVILLALAVALYIGLRLRP